jgi:hypothetical protein
MFPEEITQRSTSELPAAILAIFLLEEPCTKKRVAPAPAGEGVSAIRKIDMAADAPLWRRLDGRSL